MADNAKNFAKVTVSTGYDATATSIALTTGHGAKLPTAPFNVVWWNSTDYADPSDDPNVEIVRVTAISTDTLTVTRAQEGTTATTKNTAGKTYKMIAGLTAKTINTDLAIGGSITQVQFNDGGVLGGDAGFTWDKTNDKLTVGASYGEITSAGGLWIHSTGNNNDLDLSASDATNAATPGSNININAGIGNTTGAGGTIYGIAGNGGTDGNGGDVDFTAGNAGGGNRNGGHILLRVGTKSGSGVDGKVKIINPSGINAILDPSSVATSDKTFTFPNQSGTIALTSDITGGLVWSVVTGTSQAAAVDNGYITNNAGLVTITLPDTAAVGKVVRVVGLGAGGWRISQNASENIRFGNTVTTTGTGGYLASSNQYDAVELVCVIANTTWAVVSSVGNITIV